MCYVPPLASYSILFVSDLLIAPFSIAPQLNLISALVVNPQSSVVAFISSYAQCYASRCVIESEPNSSCIGAYDV